MEITDYNIKKGIIHHIPNLELSNENIVHNKVHYNNIDYVRFIPKGLKGILIFKKDKTRNNCYFIELLNYKTNKKTNLYINNNNYKKKILIHKIYKFNCSFDDSLCCSRGTILYGTFCMNRYIHKELHYFVAENILYYKGTQIKFSNWNNMFELIYNCIYHNIQNRGVNNNSIIITTPITRKLPYNFNSLIETLEYDVYCIQFIENRKYNTIIKKINKVCKTYFYIKAKIQSDIYEIYDITDKYVGICYIPDYKTSVYLNTVFRNIKENHNLDFIEESDDEDDFEDISLDKYVDLEKKEVFECVYNNKFNMWLPRKHIHKEDMTKINIRIHKI